MACNCKKAKEFSDEYGIPEDEALITTITRYCMKIFFFVATVILAAITVPYLVSYAVYAVFFGDNQITLPKFLRKHLE